MHLFDYQKSGFLLKNPSIDNQLDRFNFVIWSLVGFRSSSYFNHAKLSLPPSLQATQASWRFSTS